ncbi:Uncharacterized protein Rs2_08975 [Raphanus sativus]|nr:Uncharacterized protein Rs2_08975 [Raphanus sativus]
MSGLSTHIMISYIRMRRTQVVVLCTESVVCGLASHTSLSDSPVAHPSFFSLSEEEEKKTKKRLVFDIEDTPKEKGSRPLFSMQRCRDYNLLFDRVRQYQRRFRVPFSRPVQLILSFTLILFLLLLFRVY